MNDNPSLIGSWIKQAFAAICQPEPERTPLPAGRFIYYRHSIYCPWVEVERETAEMLLTEAHDGERFAVKE